MHDLFQILVPIACGCVLPIVIIWLNIRQRMNETNKRTQVVLAAIEKNPDMDIEELIKKISPKKKLLKEKLLEKLLWGCITVLLGIGMIVCHIYVDITTNSTSPCGFIGIILLAVGIAFFVNYRLGKKMLAKEIEAEEKRVSSCSPSAAATKVMQMTWRKTHWSRLIFRRQAIRTRRISIHGSSGLPTTRSLITERVVAQWKRLTMHERLLVQTLPTRVLITRICIWP